MDNYLQTGYVTRDSVVIEHDGNEFLIQYYQGEHGNELMMIELEDGKRNGSVKLYRNGVIVLSWIEKEGERIGDFCVYEKGIFCFKQSWDNYLHGEEWIRIINTKQGEAMEIVDTVSKQVVYRGGFNTEFKRDGYGAVYDSENGQIKQTGIFQNDDLFRVIQDFDGELMTEYSSDGDSNLPLLLRKPIYHGGYGYDKSTNQYKRNGTGYMINPSIRMACYECEYEMGVEKKRTELVEGVHGESEVITKGEVELLKEELERVNKELTEQSKRIEELNSQLKSADERCAFVNGQIKEKELIISQKNMELMNLRFEYNDSIEEKDGELDEQDELITKKENQLTNALNHVKNRERIIEKKDEELEEKKEEIRRLNAVIREKNATIKQLSSGNTGNTNNQKANNQKENNKKGNNQKENNKKANNQKENNQKGNNQKGNNQKGNNQKGNNQRANNQKGNNQRSNNNRYNNGQRRNNQRWDTDTDSDYDYDYDSDYDYDYDSDYDYDECPFPYPQYVSPIQRRLDKMFEQGGGYYF